MARSARMMKVAAASVLAAGAAIVAPAAANAALPVGGGTPIVVGGTAGCTLTAAGFDRDNRPVAFTAAHCSEGLHTPVSVQNAPTLGTVGTVEARNEQLDYSVIALDTSKVVPVRQAGVAGTGGLPATGDTVCKDGMATGHTCGLTWQSDDTRSWSQMCAGHGDSGGPVTKGDRLVGMISGGDLPPAAGGSIGSGEMLIPSCIHPAQTPFFLPALSVSFEKITGDATARNWPGAGFRMP